jgi:putative RecB family exonuclease
MTEVPVQQQLRGMPRRLYSASPSRLLAWLDCPRRYRMQYLDRPKPVVRTQRAHTSVGLAAHNALRDFWDLAPVERTPSAVGLLVRRSWVDVGFRDPDQSADWRDRTTQLVTAYLRGVDRDRQPLGVERTVSLRTQTLAVTGRVDRLDDREGELVVVDYKTGQGRLTDVDARTSLPLAMYAVAAAGMFRRPCVRVELHHLPTATVLTHEHTPETLQRKVAEAESIAADLRRADADYAKRGAESTLFEPRVSPLCAWCDFRAHCPEGQRVGPEKSDWAGLETRVNA